ncbi:MAG: amidase [Rhodospirillaceae bacterium]|nr:amidase [Rhodospirillaceae bacterium]
MAAASHVDVKNLAGGVPGLSAAAAAIHENRLSVDGYIAACLRRIASEEDRVRAFTACDRDEAEKRAYVFDRMPAGKRGPIHGIPYAVSTAFDIKGEPSNFAPALREERFASADAAIVAASRKAGAIAIGTTSSAEFGCFGAGAIGNPWAEARSSGGSGAAAAVASGMLPLAFGWRPDGAIAVSAGYCGIYGLKPTRGAIPGGGVQSLVPSLESVGLYVREAADVALVSQLFLGYKHLADRGDLASCADTLAVQILDGASAYRIQPPARSALNRAVTALSDARVEIAHRRFSPGFVKAERCYDTIFSYEIAQELARDRDRLPDAMGEEALVRIDHGRQVGASAYELARRDVIAMRSELLDQLEGNTVLLDVAIEGVAPIREDDTGWSPMQALWALTGIPTLVVPCGLMDGLPIGVQIAAAPGREDLLARTASIIEGRMET